MSRQLVDERPTAVDPPDRKRPMEWADLWNAFPAGTWVAAAAAVRGAVVAVTGIVATVTLAVVVWTITPQSGDDATAALHAGFAALAAANLLPITIGGVVLTLPPLLLTLLVGWLLASTARRGRFRPAGRVQEAMVTLVGGGVYGLLVLVLTRGFGAEGVVSPGTGPFVVGVLGFGVGTLGRDSAWRAWWRSMVPHWVTVAFRAAAVGSMTLIGGAAALLAVSLGLHFSSALTVATAVAPSGLDGAGLALLGLMYLPNAVLAAAGYSLGAGVQVGSGAYHPWGATPAELPGLPFLAALPTSPGPSAALVALAGPVLAAVLLGWTAVRSGLPTRQDRTLAAGAAAGAGAILLGLVVFAAGGGVGTGRWAVIGSSAPVAAAAAAAVFAVVGTAITGLTAWRTVPWRAVRAPARTAARRPRTSRRSPAGARRSAAHDGAGGPDRAADEVAVHRAEPDTDDADETPDEVSDEVPDHESGTGRAVGSGQAVAPDEAVGPDGAAVDGEAVGPDEAVGPGEAVGPDGAAVDGDEPAAPATENPGRGA